MDRDSTDLVLESGLTPALPAVPDWAMPLAEGPLSLRFLAAQARTTAVHDLSTFTPPSNGLARPVLLRIRDAAEVAALEPLLAIAGDLRLAVAFDPADPRHAGLPPCLARHGYALFHIDDTAEAFRRLVAPAAIPRGWLYASRAAGGLFFAHGVELDGADRGLPALLEELAGDHGAPCTLVVPGEGPLAAAARRTGAAVLVDRRLVQWCQGAPPDPADLARRMAAGDAEAETMRLAARLAEVEAAQGALLASASWRATAPLRALGRRMPVLGRTARRFVQWLRALAAPARPRAETPISAPPAPAGHEAAATAFPEGRLAQWRWAIRRIRFMYHRVNGRLPALFRPRRFTEKVQWRKLFGLDPAFAILSDKLAAREWVSARVGQGQQARLLWVGTDPAHIPLDVLAMPCVLKSTHASGHVAMLTTESDHAAVRAAARGWLDDRFGLNMVEPGYIPVPPRLIVEERLTTPEGGPPTEHRVMVFNGVARVVQVTIADATGHSHTRGFFDRDWDALPIFLISTERPKEVARPARLVELLGLAERLAAGLDFARVDIFDCGDRLVVGEITLYPWSGLLPFRDPAQDLALGAMWQLRWPMVTALWSLAFRRWAIKPAAGAPRI